jgi:hypothetical protein
MAQRLKPTKITAVAFCEQGASYDHETGDGAHLTLFKSAEDTMQNDTVYQRIAKAAAARYATLPTATAIAKFCTETAEGRRLYAEHSRQVSGGSSTPVSIAASAPVAITKHDATRKLGAVVDVLVEKACMSPVQAWPLAAAMFPQIAASYAGHGALVRKAQPTAEQLLNELAAYYADIQQGLHRVADVRAAELTGNERRDLVAALLNAFNNS